MLKDYDPLVDSNLSIIEEQNKNLRVAELFYAKIPNQPSRVITDFAGKKYV